MDRSNFITLTHRQHRAVFLKKYLKSKADAVNRKIITPLKAFLMQSNYPELIILLVVTSVTLGLVAFMATMFVKA